MGGRSPRPGSEDPKNLIDRVIARAVRPLVAEHGFRKSSRTWRRKTPEGLHQILNVQASPWNRRGRDDGGATRAAFTLNVGIFVPGLGQLIDWPVQERPRGEHDCHVGLRIGQLAGKPDIWWDVVTDGSDNVGIEVEDLLREVVLPWFDQCSTVAGLVDWIEVGSQLVLLPVRTGLSLFVGDHDRAQAEVDRAQGVTPEFVAWALRHGLDPPPAEVRSEK